MTYSVKSIYPEFKCLTAHRAVMKRIETAQKKSEKTDREFKFVIIKKAKLIYASNKKIYMKEFEDDLTKEEALYFKSKEFGRKWGKFGYNHQMWIDENHKLRNANPWFYNRDMYEPNYCDMYGGTYGISNNKKEYKFFLWKLKKMDEIEKRVVFYDAMLSRDYKEVTLCDDVIGLIYEYL
jgi:hypothetical protein